MLLEGYTLENNIERIHLETLLVTDDHRVRLEAGASSATVNLSHIPPAPASSYQSGNSVFLSHHSSSSLQLQPAERGECFFLQRFFSHLS